MAGITNRFVVIAVNLITSGNIITANLPDGEFIFHALEFEEKFSVPNWFLEIGVDVDLLRAQQEAGGDLEYGEVSTQCLRSLLVLADGTTHFQPWALLMKDSNGKPLAGTYEGAINWVGSYEECRRNKATFWTAPNTNEKHDFDGKYCRLQWSLIRTYHVISVAVCVPTTCTADDVTELIRNRMVNDTDTRKYLPATCSEKKSLGGASIAELVILCIFGVLVVIATITEYFLVVRRSSQKSGDHPESEAPQTVTIALTEDGRVAENDEELENMSPRSESSTNNDKCSPDKATGALFCFSLFTTAPRVFDLTITPSSFPAMNGLRVIICFWIILGHTWQLGRYVSEEDHSVTDYYWPPLSFLGFLEHSLINNMNFAVEVFFVLSGCLVTISFMTSLKSQKGRVTLRQMVLYYVHRYWRLTPVYLAIILAFSLLFHEGVDGPMFPERFYEAAYCRSEIWGNLLYINTIVHNSRMCMPWGWYLSNDFQFYVIAPVFIFLLFRWPKVGTAVLGVAVLGSVVISGVVLSRVRFIWDYFFNYYYPSWCRFGSYAVGITLGHIMYRTRHRWKPPIGLVIAAWLVTPVFILTPIIFSAQRNIVGIVYSTLNRPMFAAGWAWVILASCRGFGGFINWFLSWRIFVPLARVTYTGYLIHPIVIYYLYYTSVRLVYVDVTNMVVYYGAVVLYTVLISFVFKLVVEEPFCLLEQVLLPKRKTS